MPDITIAVCTRNRRDSLAATLASLEEQVLPDNCTVEVMVIDNGSIDGTADMVQSYAKRSTSQIRLVREDHPGVAAARNRAVNDSTGMWIAFIDDDETAAPGWLTGLYTAAINGSADCVGGRLQLVLPFGNTHDIRGAARKHLDETKQPRGFISRFIYTGPGTGNVLISRAVFDRIGGFNELLAYRGEDQDFFRRASNAGFRIIRTEDALVYHHLPPERLTREALIATAKTNGRSLAFFDKRYKGAVYLIFVMALRIMHAILLSLPRYFWAVIRGDTGSATGWACSYATAWAYIGEGLKFLFSRQSPSDQAGGQVSS